MCEFCEKFDFSTAKATVNKYGAWLVFADSGYRFTQNEQFKFCPMCGTPLAIKTEDVKPVAAEQDCLNHIDGAIEYFWCPDAAFVWCDAISGNHLDEPLLVHPGNIGKVWTWFTEYAIQYITECLLSVEGKTVKDDVVARTVNNSFERWIKYQKLRYPDRVLI